MEFRSPLARARGLGAAHHGAAHWWHQRISALVLIPAGLWLAVSLALLPAVTTETARTWVGHPINALLLITYLFAACYHGALGVQVMLEDYVGPPWPRIGGILAAKAALLAAAIVSAYAILLIAIGN